MLTEKQKRFADEYLIDLNATRAYKTAYLACKNENAAAASASKLLRNPKVTTYIAEKQQALQQKTQITQERVLQEYAKLAFFDPRKLFDDQGKPLDITQLDDETAAALAGLDVNDFYEGFGDDRQFMGYVKKYKLADKKGALDSLARHLGMFTDKTEVSGDIHIELAGEIKEWSK